MTYILLKQYKLALYIIHVITTKTCYILYHNNVDMSNYNNITLLYCSKITIKICYKWSIYQYNADMLYGP